MVTVTTCGRSPITKGWDTPHNRAISRSLSFPNSTAARRPAVARIPGQRAQRLAREQRATREAARVSARARQCAPAGGALCRLRRDGPANLQPLEVVRRGFLRPTYRLLRTCARFRSYSVSRTPAERFPRHGACRGWFPFPSVQHILGRPGSVKASPDRGRPRRQFYRIGSSGQLGKRLGFRRGRCSAYSHATLPTVSSAPLFGTDNGYQSRAECTDERLRNSAHPSNLPIA